MKIIYVIKFFLFMCSTGLFAKEVTESAKTKTEEKVFYSHMSTPAATLGHHRIAYEVFPGANGLDSFLLNSFSIGLGEKFQVGTVPIAYYQERHKFNINMKWNFYRSENSQWALGATTFLNRLENNITIIDTEGNQAVIDELNINVVSLSHNYFFKDYPLVLGATISNISLSSESKIANKALENLKYPTEWLVDLSYIWHQHRFTGGFGRHRVNSLDFSENNPFGFGMTYHFLRDKKWFSRVSVGGQYIPDFNKLQLLFSFSIL